VLGEEIDEGRDALVTSGGRGDFCYRRHYRRSFGQSNGKSNLLYEKGGEMAIQWEWGRRELSIK